MPRSASWQLLPRAPGSPDLNSGRQQLLDLDGAGRNDLVQLQPPLSGYYRQAAGGAWEPFRCFEALPNLDWTDPKLKFVDLTGDGRIDLLITEDNVVTWYPSRGGDGFAAAERVAIPFDEERGPRLLASGESELLYLADMSGDGLVDLVRIRNGEVCYWPNLGYGRFGRKVMLGGVPLFDHPDQFSQQRLRLADVDGSGVTDLLYLGRDEIRIYFNQSGNSLSEPRVLRSHPLLDRTLTVSVVDLLGNGTACLLFSSPLAGEAGHPLRYVDLMGGQKPYLLTRIVNNLGAETHIRYAASTKFYLADRAAGQPWITKLPFPVHVIERVETYDAISHSRFVSRYAYHHGYYDGVERELRGFGRVDQWDTEELAALQGGGILPPAGNDGDPASHVPPVLTRTWFHTGAYLDGAAGQSLAHEYFRAPGQRDLLPETVLPGGLTLEEERQACRALRGSILRQEIYAQDGSDRAAYPYTVSERNYTVEVLQDRAGNRHGVFFVHPRESLTFQYERAPEDPRVSHELVLEVDEYGNVLRSASIAYGRRDEVLPGADGDRQAQPLMVYSEDLTSNAVDDPDDHRGRLPYSTSKYELIGLAPPAGGRLQLAEVDAATSNARELAYEAAPTSGLEKRLLQRTETLYRRRDLCAVLPLGTIDARALVSETYQLALTPELVTGVYGARVADSMLAAGGYVQRADGRWWIPSGKVFYSPDPLDACAAELAHAEAHFFLPRRALDPFAQTSTVAYDAYDLLPVELVDPLGNRTTVGARRLDGSLDPAIPGNDYRVLGPILVMDANRNRAAAAFDALGFVVGTAVMGKPEEALGDSLEDFVADLPDATRDAHLAAPLADPAAILKRATTRLVYDLFAYQRSKDDAQPQPAVVYTLARWTHDADLPAGSTSPLQHRFVYSDGFGREVQTKAQAAPGALLAGGATIDPRWVGSGWTIFNNKGKPVRQYEPFFSSHAPLRVRAHGRRQRDPVLRSGRAGHRHAPARITATRRWCSTPGSRPPGTSTTPSSRTIRPRIPTSVGSSPAWRPPITCRPGTRGARAAGSGRASRTRRRRRSCTPARRRWLTWTRWAGRS